MTGFLSVLGPPAYAPHLQNPATTGGAGPSAQALLDRFSERSGVWLSRLQRQQEALAAIGETARRWQSHARRLCRQAETVRSAELLRIGGLSP